MHVRRRIGGQTAYRNSRADAAGTPGSRALRSRRRWVSVELTSASSTPTTRPPSDLDQRLATDRRCPAATALDACRAPPRPATHRGSAATRRRAPAERDLDHVDAVDTRRARPRPAACRGSAAERPPPGALDARRATCPPSVTSTSNSPRSDRRRVGQCPPSAGYCRNPRLQRSRLVRVQRS